MPSPRRLTIILVPVALVLLHLWVKAHINRLRPFPLATDPCDAVNIAGFTVILLSGIWTIVRLLQNTSSQEQREINSWRTAEAIILTILFTVAAELIALLRNLPLLHPQQRSVLPLLAVEALFALAAQALLLWVHGQKRNRTSRLAIALWILAPLAVLTVSPEWTIDGNTLLRHLLTVLVGICALLLPVHSLTLLLTNAKPGLRSTTEKLSFTFGLILVLIGFWVLGHAPHTQGTAFLLNFVGCLTMTFAALAHPLGMRTSTKP